jgi:hypothetical protein
MDSRARCIVAGRSLSIPHELSVATHTMADVLREALVRLHAQDATLASFSLPIGWVGAIGETGVASLAAALRVNRTLTTLCLNWIGDSGAAALAGALGVNRTLTSLSLAYGSFGAVGAVALAGALHVNTTLTSLSLGWDEIGDKGAESLTAALCVNSTLTRLLLAGCGIGDSGAVSMADALRVNHTITSLGLLHNSIGDAGAALLADALHHNNTLTSLDLTGNRIGEVGALAVARALRANPTLHILTWSFRLATVLAAELSPDERQLGDAALLAHWRRRRRGQTKLAWLLGTLHQLAGRTNPSPLAALASSAMWDRQLVRELFEWSGDADVPLVAAEPTLGAEQQ